MKTKHESVAPAPKGRVKINDLKLSRKTVENVTNANAGAVKGGLGGNHPHCCVARTVYGEDNPRWRLFRAWLRKGAPGWFRGLYLRHGERFAGWIAPRPVLKSAVRCWMDFVIDRKHSGKRMPTPRVSPLANRAARQTTTPMEKRSPVTMEVR